MIGELFAFDLITYAGHQASSYSTTLGLDSLGLTGMALKGINKATGFLGMGGGKGLLAGVPTPNFIKNTLGENILGRMGDIAVRHSRGYGGRGVGFQQHRFMSSNITDSFVSSTLGSYVKKEGTHTFTEASERAIRGMLSAEEFALLDPTDLRQIQVSWAGREFEATRQTVFKGSIMGDFKETSIWDFRKKTRLKRKIMHKTMGGKVLRKPGQVFSRMGAVQSAKTFGTSFAVRAGIGAAGSAMMIGFNLMIGYDIAESIYNGMSAYEFSDPFQVNSFSENAMDVFTTPATQRQAALAQLHNSQLNIRYVLGNESGAIHA